MLDINNIKRVKRVLSAYGGTSLTLANIKPITWLDYFKLNLSVLPTTKTPQFNVGPRSYTYWDLKANNGKGGIGFKPPQYEDNTYYLPNLMWSDFQFVPLTNPTYEEALGLMRLSNYQWTSPVLPTELTKPTEVSDVEPVILAGVTNVKTEETTSQPALSTLSYGNVMNGLTMMGAMTGNKTMMNIGQIGSTALSISDLIKLLKGLRGENKTAGIAGIAGTAADTARNVMFSGVHDNDSALTSGLNQGYDAISTSLMGFTPVGTIIGGAMKVGGFVGDALSSMGVGTDLMTTTDLVLDSNFMKLTPVGLINAIGAKKTLNFSADNLTLALVGGSYGGSVKDINNAVGKAGKKYGLFSGDSRRSADRQISTARGFQNTMADIAKDASDRSSIAGSMSDLNHLSYGFNMNGGYDLRYMRAAKDGAKLSRIRKLQLHKVGGIIKLSINLDTKEIEDKPVEWTPIITEPVELFEDGGVIEEWTPVITDPIEEFKEGGKTEEVDTPEIEETELKNVIPEGALHARKHHMENAENLTEKGIPVIDLEGDQLAEIELNEIIFTLEVTKKLEELLKDGSDEAAIEAGKLLVEQILFNTEDRTGLINTLKLGGVIESKNE